MEEERTRLQKIVLLALAVMAVVFGILMIVSKLHPGLLLDGALLRPTETADTVTYAGKLHGEQVSLSVRTESNTVTVISCETESGGSDVYRMEYPLAPILAVDGFAQGEMVDGIRITKNEAVLFDQGAFGEITVGSAGQSSPLDLNIQDVVWLGSGPELTARGSWALYAVMLLCSLVLALDAAFPLALFYWRHMCDVRDPEPSDFYLIVQRIGWVVYPILIFIGYIWALRYLP